MSVIHAEQSALTTRVKIAHTIRQARLEQGLKQEALAAQMGMQRNSTITEVERGRLVPSVDLAARFEKALHLPRHTLTSMVLKYQVEQNTATVMSEAKERGIPFKVRVLF